MTQYKPFLIVSRLIVTKGGRRVYDEHFKAGVNIIRGDNSSGKSTISDFIFYGLGGELSKWKFEAGSCDFIYVEVNLSGSVYTLKRAIQKAGRASMDFFSGSFDCADAADKAEWIRYPFKADTKESFYQVMFKELRIPYSKSDDKNSITMHQLLRMMYVDQMTSPDRIFKFDKFDSSAKRRAIGELLIGVSDFDLYTKRVEFQNLDAQLDKRIKEIETIHGFLGKSVKSLDQIDSEISDKKNAIDALEEEIAESSFIVEDSFKDDHIIQDMVDDVQNARENYTKIENDFSRTFFEISDSQLFVTSLKSRIEALIETKKTISVLSDIAFDHCPACQVRLQKKEKGCSVCGTESDDYKSDADPTFKVRKEIEFQIEESKKLIERRRVEVGALDVKRRQFKTKLEELERELAIALKPNRAVSLHLKRKLNEIGSLKNQVSALNDSKEEFGKLYELYQEKEDLQVRVASLKEAIDRLEKKQQSRIKRKKNHINGLVQKLIMTYKHEEVFTQGQKIEFDFGEDRVTIDERALFSASSMVYLKNAFRLAILQASCTDESYLYPRFLLMDNIEDKGMQEEGSQKFQRDIVRISKSLSVDHQIIFTTSMIDPDLNASEYCVGSFYNDDNKTLKV